ncbi:Arm DNA-binding domain-containing protein [Sphingomonas oryzagri]
MGSKTPPFSDRAYKMGDGNGLYLLVSPTGSNTWRYKYRMELRMVGRFADADAYSPFGPCAGNFIVYVILNGVAR